MIQERIILLKIITAFLFLAGTAFSVRAQYHRYVDPFIGSEGEGNVFIGPSCPFGMVKPGPDISKGSNSGYVADMKRSIYGFSQVHVSGTGGGPKYGNITVMPFSGEFGNIKHESLRSNEKATLGYYSVQLQKWNIKAEITTSPRVSYYRFQFAPGAAKAVKLDGGEFLGETPVPDAREAQQFVGSEVEVVNDTTVRGFSKIRGGWNNGKAYTVFYTAVFSKPFSRFVTWRGDEQSEATPVQVDEGKKTGVKVFFGPLNTDIIEVKIGISFISELKAAQNLSQEIPGWGFEQTLENTRNRWEDLLKRIEIDQAATVEKKTMFYTALYHTMLMPADRTGENPLWENTTPYYDDFYAVWDTYRSSSPLITLISPARQTDMVIAMLQIYKRDGYLPEARSGNSNGRVQGGSNCEVVIADAYVKELKGVNYHLGLEAMLKDANIPPGGNEEQEGRGGLTDYNSLGYVSTNFVRAGNRTIEYAYNDFCLAAVAKGLGRNGEYYRFLKQSDNWQNLWRDIHDNGARGFIMPKDAAGRWVDSFQCDVSNGRFSRMAYTPTAQDWPNCVCWWCGFFYEANSWEYSLSIPHDVGALVKKSGGPEAFKKRLDILFDKKFYNVGNEPSFLSPLLYHWIGKPYLSSDRVHQIVDEYFTAKRDGIPGNDDSGAMSSWLAFHMMGFYPNAGQPYYLVNTPYFEKTIIHLENGKDFTIRAVNFSAKNKYIKSATLNGKPLEQAWFTHQEITDGGELVLTLDAVPSTAWGTKTVPPSKSDQQ